MIKRRSIGLCILFTIITFGLYSMYLMAAVTDETNSKDQSGWAPSGFLVVLFGLLTCGAYTIYWLIRMAIRVKNMQNDDSAMIFIIVFGILFGIGTFVIQHYNNKMVTGGSNQIA